MSWISTLVTAAVGKIEGIFEKEIPTLTAAAKTEFSTVEAALQGFAKTDLGNLAIDAVNYAATLGQTGTTAQATAKTKFVEDAKTAGHDLTTIGSGIVDWMIQTAYTVVNGVVAQIGTPTA
jgi:hypothetical protein